MCQVCHTDVLRNSGVFVWCHTGVLGGLTTVPGVPSGCNERIKLCMSSPPSVSFELVSV